MIIFSKYFRTAAIALLLSASTAGQAMALPATGYARGAFKPSSTFISLNQPTLAPFAFARFCVQNRQDCSAGSGQEVVSMTPKNRALLFRINATVNRAIKPVNDNANAGDVWQVNVSSGDCEDFALTKRRQLIAAGWSARSLRIVVARTAMGEGHAVLAVKTTDGDVILDNRTNAIRPWNRTDLHLLKIQSGENPRLWYDL